MDAKLHRRLTRRGFLLRGAALGLAAIAPLSGCENRGFTFLGYDFGAEKIYDTSIHTVYVPLFHNRAFQTTPYRGMEVEITKAVIREIESKTPYKVVASPENADTELIGSLVMIQKFILNRTQQNTAREAEVVINLEVLWRDLRTADILSAPRQALPNIQPGAPGSDTPQFDPNLPVPPPLTAAQPPLPVPIVARGRMLPELGETNATAEQIAINNAAVQIVSMMEKPWRVRSRNIRSVEQQQQP